MTDAHRDNSVGERKLIWDEENRLLAVDDNGFVSNYWYDADGERTVKTSGESDQVYVNGVFSGGSTNTAALVLRLDPEKGRLDGKDYFKESRENIIYGAKWEEFDKEIKEYAATLPMEINDRAIKMYDPKNCEKE